MFTLESNLLKARIIYLSLLLAFCYIDKNQGKTINLDSFFIVHRGPLFVPMRGPGCDFESKHLGTFDGCSKVLIWREITAHFQL